MSIDKLQDKIRKGKNPSMVDFSVSFESIPAHILQEETTPVAAYSRFCRELLDGLKEIVPAVRFSYNTFALLGADGLPALSGILQEAQNLGYYVLLDCPGIMSVLDAEQAANVLFGSEKYPCDALLIHPYLGSDSMKPFLPFVKDQQKDLFVAVRTPNKSAREIQDLLTGSRHVHIAAADIANRLGENLYGSCGYSRVAAMASAGEANILRSLRGAYNRMFLLVDGVDLPGSNFKNCSNAFDRFGHGAVVCAATSVTAAWKAEESDGADYVAQAQQAAERMKKNLVRYITVL